jgi:fatty-acyl-CoA synthase
MAILGGVQFGCRMILMRQFEPQRANTLIESEGVIGMMGVPTMLIGMLEADAAIPRDFSSVEMAGSGGAMVPPELIRRVTERLGCGFYTVYGQTETSPLLTQSRASDPFEDLCNTVGQPMPHTEISIRDPATGAVLPLDTVGEICARAYSVMLGYNDDPEATAKTIDADGWLHTGDLGTMDARGFVKVTGRVKEMIIRGGENLFPAEIENVLLEHADVA